MAAATAPGSTVEVDALINAYFTAWQGTDEDRIMSYYADDVRLQIPGTLMEGKEAVLEQFVRPFITGFPGNRHLVKKMIYGPGVVAVEWTFDAEHKGPFAGHAATDARISVPGCGVYEYDLARQQISAGRIYLDMGTLLKQIITDLLVDDHNWTEDAYRIFEFDPASRVTMQMVRERVHPEDLQSFNAVIARGMAGMDLDFGFRIVTGQGAVKHVRAVARIVEEFAGRRVFSGDLQDVTESKAAEETLNRTRSELARMARVTTLSALTASIAHEINQPLTGIITNANACLRMLDVDPPNVDGARETVRRALRDGNRASDVIARLRALYSKREFTLEPVDLNEATREVIALSLSDLQRSRVIVRSELADDLPPVAGDRVQLQQVILNLVRNASEAMSTVDDRPRELLIRTELDTNNQVCLTVKDVGVGIAPEAAAKLFQAFFTTKSDGMGIGLSVSHSIIDAHHGHLRATANDGPGATFSFALPCGSGASQTA